MQLALPSSLCLCLRLQLASHTLRVLKHTDFMRHSDQHSFSRVQYKSYFRLQWNPSEFSSAAGLSLNWRILGQYAIVRLHGPLA